MENTSALLLFVCDCLAFPVVIFLRRDFGRRYIGLQGLGVLAPLFWPIFMPQDDPRGMLVFFVLILIACLLNRIGGLFRRKTIAEIHSRYSGTPYLQAVLRNWNEITIKQIGEPLFVLAMAAFVESVSLQLTVYLIVAAFALAISVAADQAAEHRRVEDLHDAYLEQQALAEQFREKLNQRR